MLLYCVVFAAITASNELSDYMRRNNVNPLKNLVVPLAQVFVVLFYCSKMNFHHYSNVTKDIQYYYLEFSVYAGSVNFSANLQWQIYDWTSERR